MGQGCFVVPGVPTFSTYFKAFGIRLLAMYTMSLLTKVPRPGWSRLASLASRSLTVELHWQDKKPDELVHSTNGIIADLLQTPRFKSFQNKLRGLCNIDSDRVYEHDVRPGFCVGFYVGFIQAEVSPVYVLPQPVLL